MYVYKGRIHLQNLYFWQNKNFHMCLKCPASKFLKLERWCLFFYEMGKIILLHSVPEKINMYNVLT